MDRRDVVITGFRLNASEQPSKVLQRVLGMDEDQARGLSKRFPCVVREDEAWAEAERLMHALRDAGAYAHLREPSARTEAPSVSAPSSVPPAPSVVAAPVKAAQVEPEFAERPAAATLLQVAAPSMSEILAAALPIAARRPAPAPVAAVAPMPAATPVAVVQAAAPAPVAVAPALISQLAPLPKEEWGSAPTLFSAAAAEPPVPDATAQSARVSRYSLGEIEIVAPKSQPAPPMVASPSAPATGIKSQPAPAFKSQPAPAFKSQPAPAPKSQPAPAFKSQPAPAFKSQPAPAFKSQPAPAPKSQPAPAFKSQPAPAPKSQPAPAQDIGLEAAGLRMLGDSFQDEADDGRLFELDERALGHQTNRVQTQPRGNASIAAPPRKRRGLFATLLLPLVLAQAAIPHALALTGVAAASGAAVYIARTAGREEAGDQASADKAEDADVTLGSAPNKRRVRAKKEGIMGMLDRLTGGDKEDDAQLAGGQNKDKQIDDADLAADPGSEKMARKEATHPLVRMAPEAMEGSIAAILRTRIRGVHKVAVKWEDGTRPEGNVECMLLEQAEAANLKELASTGSVVDLPPAVRDQLKDHILVLRTANAEPDANYLPICLAN